MTERWMEMSLSGEWMVTDVGGDQIQMGWKKNNSTLRVEESRGYKEVIKHD